MLYKISLKACQVMHPHKLILNTAIHDQQSLLPTRQLRAHTETPPSNIAITRWIGGPNFVWPTLIPIFDMNGTSTVYNSTAT